MEVLLVLGAIIASAQCLCGKGEAVHYVGVENEELHQHGVYRQYYCSAFGTRHNDVEVHGNEEQSAIEQSAVDHEEAFHLRHAHSPLQLDAAPHGGISHTQHDECHQYTAPLRQQCAHGHAFDFHSHAIDEEAGEADVHHILRDGDNHGQRGVLHPYEPSREGVERKRWQCSPYAYIIIGVDDGLQRCFGGYEPHGK